MFGVLAASGASVVLSAGCDQGAPVSPDIGPPSSAPSTAPATEPTSQPAVGADGQTLPIPGYAVGRVMGADGKPITLKGARIELRFLGSSEPETRMEVGPDGFYKKELKSGRYLMPAGRIEFPFGDRTYSLPLTPTRPDDPAIGDAHEGIVRDFVWKLTGARDLPREAAKPDPRDPAAWIGGTVYASYDSLPQGRPIAPPPTDTLAIFTFTPRGALADGSTTKPIVVERGFDISRSQLEVPQISDLPLAWWTVTAIEKLPDGRTTAMEFRQPDGTWKPSIEGTFDHDLQKDLLKPIEIQFTRKQN